MNFKEHRQRWNNCQACSLCETRKHVVLARGSIPCDILLVGEAPGTSEDVHGQPFYGPAGHLLDKILDKASRNTSVKFAFTNLVACIPLGEDGKKTAEPNKESIEACSERLEEFIGIAKPRVICCVGRLSHEHMQGYNDGMMPFAMMIHPAAILRAETSQQGLLIQNCVVMIADLIQEIGL